MIEPKPCPFCGCSVEIVECDFRWCAFHHTNPDIEWCPVETVCLDEWAEAKYLEKAIAKWNMRANE